MPSPAPRILVVDDEESLLLLIQSVLALEGFAVDAVGSAEEALEGIASAHYDLVITDNNMPGMHGLELATELGKSHPDLPVILMTAYGSINMSMRAHSLGVSGYLLKPFDDIDVIVQEVRRVLGRASRDRGL